MTSPSETFRAHTHTDLNIIIIIIFSITITLASTLAHLEEVGEGQGRAVATRVIFTHLLSSVVHFGSVIVYIIHKLSGKTVVLLTSFFHAPHCACSSSHQHGVALLSFQPYTVIVVQVE